MRLWNQPIRTLQKHKARIENMMSHAFCFLSFWLLYNIISVLGLQVHVPTERRDDHTGRTIDLSQRMRKFRIWLYLKQSRVMHRNNENFKRLARILSTHVVFINSNRTHCLDVMSLRNAGGHSHNCFCREKNKKEIRWCEMPAPELSTRSAARPSVHAICSLPRRFLGMCS